MSRRLRQMGTFSVASVLMIALLSFSVLPCGAQGNFSLNIDELNIEAFPTVKALVTVRDENGTPVVGLSEASFEVVEDGAFSFPPDQVMTQDNPDAIVSVALVLDVSGSMQGQPLEEAVKAANAFLDGLQDSDRVALIAFSEEVDISADSIDETKEVPFTQDKNRVRNVLNFLVIEGEPGTPLYDAAYKAVEITKQEPEGKRAVILMTDGRDERRQASGQVEPPGSRIATEEDPINEANRHSIPVFTIGLGKRIDEHYLERLAIRTGGRYQKAPDETALTDLFVNILNQLKQQYVLTYKSHVEKDDRPHSLLVRIQGGQAFDETKFQIEQPQPVSVPTQPPGGSAGATIAPTPTPQDQGISAVVGQIRDFVQANPIIAVLIGGGVLLALLLILILLLMFLRRRGGREEEYLPPPSEWTVSPETSPAISAPTAAPTQMGEDTGLGPLPPTEFGDMPPVGAPAGPLPGVVPPPPGPPAPTPKTRIVERAPKRLAVLMDKRRPDKRFDVSSDSVGIGRSKQNNEIVLDDVTISRQHAKIKLQEEDFYLFDLGSANGTFVNGERIREPRKLEDGDVVKFGEVELVFKIML